MYTIENITKPCLREDFLTSEEKKAFKKVLIPKFHLYGIQPHEAYSRKQRKEVESKLHQPEKKGYLEYLHNPTIAIPFFDNNRAFVAITDGHHRARFVDRPIAPCLLIDVENAVEIYNRTTSSSVSVDDFAQDILDSMHHALRSFDGMPPERHPSPIYGVNSIDEIAQKFGAL